MTKLEEIAAAIWRVGYKHPSRPDWPDGVQGNSHELFRRMARAAIEAMREPTIKMLRAADNVILTDDELHAGPYEMIKAEYRAAIDAALSEGKETEA